MTPIKPIPKVSRITVIGMGAGGSYIIRQLSQYINFRQDERITITLVDGDVFESKNFLNQCFKEIGKKAEVKKAEMREENFQNIQFRSISEYLNEDNVGEIIFDGDIVFLCVDNHKTRNIVNEHCKTLQNVVLFSTGIEEFDGDVSVYIRENGNELTPDLAYNHPEIAEPKDQAPYEKSCDEIIPTEPARLITVSLAVSWTLTTFANYLEGQLDYYKLYFDTVTCRVRTVPIPDSWH